MAGAAGALALGNWLIKAETAWIDGLEFFSIPGIPREKKSRIDTLIGTEYSGYTDTTISVELANRHINNIDDAIKSAPDFAQENIWQSAFRYQSDHLHNTLHATLLASFFGLGGQDGAFQRASLKYDVDDSISATAGVILYQAGNSFFFQNIEDNDRLFLDIKYNF